MTADEMKLRNVAAMGEAHGKQYTVLFQGVTALHLYWREFFELFGTNEMDSTGAKRGDRTTGLQRVGTRGSPARRFLLKSGSGRTPTAAQRDQHKEQFGSGREFAVAKPLLERKPGREKLWDLVNVRLG